MSLGNVLSAGYKDTKVTFLTDSDKELFTKYKAPSFEVQVSGVWGQFVHFALKIAIYCAKNLISFT